MAHTPAGKTFTDLVLEVFRLNGRLLAAGERLTKPHGLTSARGRFWERLKINRARSRRSRGEWD
jgi:hypothetical protein